MTKYSSHSRMMSGLLFIDARFRSMAETFVSKVDDDIDDMDLSEKVMEESAIGRGFATPIRTTPFGAPFNAATA